jgi:hypothetical protein
MMSSTVQLPHLPHAPRVPDRGPARRPIGRTMTFRVAKAGPRAAGRVRDSAARGGSGTRRLGAGQGRGGSGRQTADSSGMKIHSRM